MREMMKQMKQLDWNPATAAITAALAVLLVYAILTISWFAADRGEPSGGWGLHLMSLIIQMAGWAVVVFWAALIVRAIRRRLRS